MSDSYDTWRKRVSDAAKGYTLEERIFIPYVESSQDARFIKSVACDTIESYRKGERSKVLKDSDAVCTFRENGRFGFTEEMVNLMMDIAIQHGYRRGQKDGFDEGTRYGTHKEQQRIGTVLGLSVPDYEG